MHSIYLCFAQKNCTFSVGYKTINTVKECTLCQVMCSHPIGHSSFLSPSCLLPVVSHFDLERMHDPHQIQTLALCHMTYPLPDSCTMSHDMALSVLPDPCTMSHDMALSVLPDPCTMSHDMALSVLPDPCTMSHDTALSVLPDPCTMSHDM